MSYDKIKKKIEKLEEKMESEETNKGPVNLLPIIKAKREGKDVHSGIPVPEWLAERIMRKRKELKDFERR